MNDRCRHNHEARCGYCEGKQAEREWITTFSSDPFGRYRKWKALESENARLIKHQEVLLRTIANEQKWRQEDAARFEALEVLAEASQAWWDASTDFEEHEAGAQIGVALLELRKTRP